MKLFTTLALVLALNLAACGGGEEIIEIDRTGTVYTYVLNGWDIPTTEVQGRELALDIDGDGSPDNKLGDLLPLLSSFGDDIDIQQQADDSLNSGEIILLMAMQATDFTTAKGVGFQVFQGAEPAVTPCDDGMGGECSISDPGCTCGRHLVGDVGFKIAKASPTNAVVAGNTIGGKFGSQGGSMILEFAISEGVVIKAKLTSAKVVITGISETGLMSGQIVGGLTTQDIETDLMPVIAKLIQDAILKDCDPDSNGIVDNKSDCPVDSTGETLLTQLDHVPEGNLDNDVTVEDLKVDSTVATVLAPDVDLLGDDGELDAISLGIGFTATTADFTLPAGGLAEPNLD